MKSAKHISSIDNPVVKRIRANLEGGHKAQKVRQESSLAIAEGIHLLQAWLGSSDLHEIYTTEAGLAMPEVLAAINTQLAVQPQTVLYLLEDSLWKKVTELVNAPPVMAAIKINQPQFPLQYTDDLVVLDGLQDAGNVGSIMRTAAAAGIKHIICMKGTAQAWTVKVLRAAMGAHRYLCIHEAWTLNDLREKVRIPFYATHLEAEMNLYDLGAELLQPKAWVFGNEGQGVSPELMAISRGIYIPQESCIESLNVASAVAICLFETVRIKHHSDS